MNEAQLLKIIELMAHKVKNPSHSVGLNLEVLRSKVKKSGAGKADDLNKNIDIIDSEMKRLNLIIEKFVEFMTPAGKEKKKTDIAKLFKILRSQAEPIAAEYQVKLEFQPPAKKCVVNINSEEICKALLYLIQNAIEGSEPGKTVMIQTEEKGKEISIHIEDSGSGVMKENGPKIFEICYTTKSKHIGMGLPLARKIIEENGGKIRMRTAAKQGTQVFITFAL